MDFTLCDENHYVEEGSISISILPNGPWHTEKSSASSQEVKEELGEGRPTS